MDIISKDHTHIYKTFINKKKLTQFLFTVMLYVRNAMLTHSRRVIRYCVAAIMNILNLSLCI